MNQATYGTSPFVLRAMAALRIYVGLLWLAYGASKLEPNWVGGKLEFLQAVKSVCRLPLRHFVHFSNML